MNLRSGVWGPRFRFWGLGLRRVLSMLRHACLGFRLLGLALDAFVCHEVNRN